MLYDRYACFAICLGLILYYCISRYSYSSIFTKEIKNSAKFIAYQISISDGLSGLLALSLLGGTVALYTPKKVGETIDRRSGQYYPQPTYAQRVAQFENKMFSRAAQGVRGFAENARRATRRLRHGLRRTGQRSLGVARKTADTIARMAKTTDTKLRGVARVASRGLRRMSSRLGYAGHGGIERMGSSAGNFGVAAVRGLVKVSRAYMRGLGKARSRLVNGLRRVGSTYKRGISRVGEAAMGVASAYSRGVARVGSAATSSLSDVASDGISRLGEVASQSAATIGGIATNVADAATAVPKSISNVAKDKKIRDCLLQAFCYVSTPFINPNSNFVKRR